VIADFSQLTEITPASLFAAGYSYSVPLDKWNISDQACDYIYAGKNKIDFALPGTLGILFDSDADSSAFRLPNSYPLFNQKTYHSLSEEKSSAVRFYLADEEFVFALEALDRNAILVLHTRQPNRMQTLRRMCISLREKGITNPLVIRQDYQDETALQVQLYASTDNGGLLIDGFGDGIWLHVNDGMPRKDINSLAFGILQATRTRISKTEYISCPSCGRTLFDLQETTAKIRNRTHHLKGVKIGIMGCIVNGPGEMADADYGYVGTGVGKITLYKGKEVVERNIDSEKAVDALIELIRKNGDWVEMTNDQMS
jgi:(E)-4-hydroxy-3-methylbut-2-enyl-diphosphate synthase